MKATSNVSKDYQKKINRRVALGMAAVTAASTILLATSIAQATKSYRVAVGEEFVNNIVKNNKYLYGPDYGWQIKM